jgi:AraC-like DNA-binding protein
LLPPKAWLRGERGMLSINPAYEVIVCAPTESFRWNVHGYPHHLAKWHYHPEYELHLIQQSRGKMMIGDFVGDFEPGCLVLTGPNLPHNWVSNIKDGEYLADRDMLIQFSEAFASSLFDEFAELDAARDVLAKAAFGLQFTGDAAKQGADLLKRIGAASGPRRLILLIELFALLGESSQSRRTLSNAAPALGLLSATTERLQKAVDLIHLNYKKSICLKNAADICNMEESTFSRFFKKQTGHNFVQFVNRLRVHHACNLLSKTDRSITDICFDSGFNNTANFNRQFFAFCRQTPSQYRDGVRRIALRPELGKF